MTTEEISRMGFTNVILLNADRWRSDDGSEAVSAAAAAGDIHYCFGMKVKVCPMLIPPSRCEGYHPFSQRALTTAVVACGGLIYRVILWTAS